MRIDEIWKDIPDTDYCVSNLGRVASRKFGKWRILKPWLNHGYPTVSMGGKSVNAYRLVAEAFVAGRTESRNEVNHKDGVRANGRADNLEWVTHLENMRHAAEVTVSMFRGPRTRDGVRTAACGAASLTEDKVREIRRLYAGGERSRAIAERFGVERCAVTRIISRKTWAWVE